MSNYKEMSKEERSKFLRNHLQQKTLYQKNLEFFLSELKERGAKVNMELIVGIDNVKLSDSRELDKIARSLNAHSENSFDRAMVHAMGSFKGRATIMLELFGFPVIDDNVGAPEEVGNCNSLFPLGYIRDVQVPSLERMPLKTEEETLDKFGFNIAERQENFFLCAAVVATLTQIQRVVDKVERFKVETEVDVKPRVSVAELTKTFVEDIKNKGYLGDLRYYAHEPSPLLDKGAYSSKNYRPVMLRGFDTAPPALLLTNASAVASVGYSRNSFKTLSENFTTREVHTVAGSRKVLLTHVEPAPLAEAEAEDIELFKAKVTSQMVKRDMVVYRGQARWNAYTEVGEIDPELIEDFDGEAKPTGNFVPGLTWAFGMDTNQKGKAYVDAKTSGSANYYDNRFISGMIRTDDMEGWDIDTDAPVVVVPKNRVTHSAQRERVQALVAYEDRYVARYDGDSGHTIIVTGTTPKRTLANIRRRIRDNVVDTLDIF